MARYEDPSEDPAIIEAIVSLKSARRALAPVYEATQSPSIWSALEDVEKALRYLEGKEEPA